MSPLSEMPKIVPACMLTLPCQNSHPPNPKADFSSCISKLIRLAHRTNVSPVLLCMAPPSVTIGFLPFSIFLKWHDQLLGSAKIIKQSTSDSSFSAGPNHAVAREGLAFFFQHDSSSVSCRSTPQVTSAHLGGGAKALRPDFPKFSNMLQNVRMFKR